MTTTTRTAPSLPTRRGGPATPRRASDDDRVTGSLGAMPEVTGFWAVVPAGGAGTRLWPLSRSGHPKFLLDLTGSGRTLLQATVDRLAPLTGDRVVVVTGAAHADAVRGQLPGAVAGRVLAEPAPRDSMAAIGLAAAVVERSDPEAVVGSFAADHVIPDAEAFRTAVREAVDVARQGHLVTLGVEPTHPATGFGYIREGAPLAGFPTARHVEEFVEKPDAERAAALPRRRWVPLERRDVRRPSERPARPAGRSGTPTSPPACEPSRPTPARLDELWPGLEKIAIDHAVAEPAAAAGRVVVVPAPFGWDDVGDFASLSALLPGSGRADRARGGRRRHRRRRHGVRRRPRPGAGSPWSVSTTSSWSTPRTRCSSPPGRGPRTSRPSSTPCGPRAAPTSPESAAAGPRRPPGAAAGSVAPVWSPEALRVGRSAGPAARAPPVRPTLRLACARHAWAPGVATHHRRTCARPGARHPGGAHMSSTLPPSGPLRGPDRAHGWPAHETFGEPLAEAAPATTGDLPVVTEETPPRTGARPRPGARRRRRRCPARRRRWRRLGLGGPRRRWRPPGRRPARDDVRLRRRRPRPLRGPEGRGAAHPLEVPRPLRRRRLGEEGPRHLAHRRGLQRQPVQEPRRRARRHAVAREAGGRGGRHPRRRLGAGRRRAGERREGRQRRAARPHRVLREGTTPRPPTASPRRGSSATAGPTSPRTPTPPDGSPTPPTARRWPARATSPSGPTRSASRAWSRSTSPPSPARS